MLVAFIAKHGMWSFRKTFCSPLMWIIIYSSKGLVEIIRHAIETRQKLVYELKLVDDKLVIDAVCITLLI